MRFYLFTPHRASGGPVDTGPEYQQDLERELFKLKQMYGKADMNTFPNFTFEGKCLQSWIHSCGRFVLS